MQSYFHDSISIGREIERLASTRDMRRYLPVSFRQLHPTIQSELFVLEINGKVYTLDEFAAAQLGMILGIGKQYPQKLIAEGTSVSANIMLKAFEHASQKLTVSGGLVLRVEGNNLVRGILPERATYIENEWYLRVLQTAIPNGRLSHWRGDDWTIYGNIVSPELFRREEDSEYGAMISLSNSELGKRPLGQRASIFRTVCANGAIVARQVGRPFRFNRCAVFNQGELENAIRINAAEQLRVARDAIDAFLMTKRYTSNVSMKAVIAAVAREINLGKRMAAAILAGWWIEKHTTPELASTLFGLVNGITRAGQAEPPATWVRFDEIGGALAAMTRDDWDSLVARASKLKAREVEAAFAQWALAI